MQDETLKQRVQTETESHRCSDREWGSPTETEGNMMVDSRQTEKDRASQRQTQKQTQADAAAARDIYAERQREKPLQRQPRTTGSSTGT